MSGADRGKQREEASRWLARADEDLAAANALAMLSPPLTGAAAYHAQQAAEKVMKGLLTVAAVPFRKTHNLNELGGQVVAVWPGLATSVDPLRPVTSWNFAYRYPAAEELSEPAPSAAAILGTLAQIKLLREAFAALLK